jgi:hypothetical protein
MNDMIDQMLTPSEATELRALVATATEQGAQAVRLHIGGGTVLLLGVVVRGELLTWFASPARDATEAAVVEATILMGLQTAAAGIRQMSADQVKAAGEAAIAADRVIRKAMH